MSRPVLNSVFASHISVFLDYREKSGIKYMYPEFYYLKRLDDFFVQEEITEISFTREQAVKWKQRLEGESEKMQHVRINTTKRFFEYLFTQGFQCANYGNLCKVICFSPNRSN